MQRREPLASKRSYNHGEPVCTNMITFVNSKEKEKRHRRMQSICSLFFGGHTVTVKMLMHQWLEGIRRQVKPATIQKYESLTSNHILPELGNLPLDHLTKDVLNKFISDCEETGRMGGGALSRKTVNDILVVLNLAMEYARDEWGFRPPKFRYLREEKKESRVLSPEEQEVLTTYLLQDTDIYKFGILLALYTGLRIGELCALRWEDITEDCICVTKTVQRLRDQETGKSTLVIGSPKSVSSNRRIPLPGFLIPYIDIFRREEGNVICTSRRTYAEPRSIQYKFSIMTACCGLKDVTVHTLRHTFATRCIEAGFDVKTLSEILGHADVKTTLNRYVHSSMELKRKNMEKLSFPEPTLEK